MMRFSTLIKHPADWMSSGDGSDEVVLTSRVRLARNLAEHVFPGRAQKRRREEVMRLLKPAVEELPPMRDGFSRELGKMDEVHKLVLVERHLISREHAAQGDGSAAVINRPQSVSIMINEEDHLRMQAIRPGQNLHEAYRVISEIDDQLAERVDFAFDDEFGYLSTCPTNLGTGIRASVMLHLPALALSDQIGQVLQAVGKLGLAVRGIFGEGSESLGHLFQISNQSTLGESEEEILTRLDRVIKQVASTERHARAKLLEDDPVMVADKIGRAYGLLRHARLVPSKEALGWLSMLRLGSDLGILPPETARLCDQLLLEIQPAHLQWAAERELSPEERDALRAEFIRSRLQNLPLPDMSQSQTTGEDDPPLPDPKSK